MRNEVAFGDAEEFVLKPSHSDDVLAWIWKLIKIYNSMLMLYISFIPMAQIIFMDESSIPSHKLFNINDWQNEMSSSIIRLCVMQYSILNHTLIELDKLLESPDLLLKNAQQTLDEQWRESAFDIYNHEYLIEVPIIHLQIQTFLIAAKTILDVIVQLLRSEYVITTGIDGFHKGKFKSAEKTPGGETLNMLANNSAASKKITAKNIIDLILKHKELWIDEVVLYRDSLTHPKKGAMPLMIKVKIREIENVPQLYSATNPRLDDKTDFDRYACKVLKNIESFCQEFTNLLRNTI